MPTPPRCGGSTRATTSARSSTSTWCGTGAWPPALGDRGPVGYVVASHVIEHVPDLVGWLGELAEVLRRRRHRSAWPSRTSGSASTGGGPRRSSATWSRPTCRPAPSPRPRQVFDFWSGIHEIDTAAAWAGTRRRRHPARPGRARHGEGGEAAASSRLRRRALLGVHAPRRSSTSLGRLMALDMVPWYSAGGLPPHRAGHAWSSTSRWSAWPTTSPIEERRRRRQEASVAAARPSLDRGVGRVAHSFVLLSEPASGRVVELKRARARQGARRARPGPPARLP